MYKVELSQLQALPLDEHPVSLWTNRDEAWVQVTAGLRRVIEDLSLLPTSLADSSRSNIDLVISGKKK
jgi:hypothetical protein